MLRINFRKFTVHCSLFTVKREPLRGFTLVEMLIVVAIIAVTASFVFVQFAPGEQLQKSRDARRKAELNQLQRSLESYYADYGRYPASSGNNLFLNTRVLNWGESWTPYMNKLPQDPIPRYNYVYFSPPSSNGQTYYLYATLERGSKDAQACNNGNACVSLTLGGGFPDQDACGGICNFGLSSPNVSP